MAILLRVILKWGPVNARVHNIDADQFLRARTSRCGLAP
jgi:hypothetical protein